MLIFSTYAVIFSACLRISIYFFHDCRSLTFDVFSNVNGRVASGFVGNFKISVTFCVIFFYFRESFRFIRLDTLVVLFVGFFRGLSGVLPLRIRIRRIFFCFTRIRRLISRFRRSINVAFCRFRIIFNLFVPVAKRSSFLR